MPLTVSVARITDLPIGNGSSHDGGNGSSHDGGEGESGSLVPYTNPRIDIYDALSTSPGIRWENQDAIAIRVQQKEGTWFLNGSLSSDRFLRSLKTRVSTELLPPGASLSLVLANRFRQKDSHWIARDGTDR